LAGKPKPRRLGDLGPPCTTCGGPKYLTWIGKRTSFSTLADGTRKAYEHRALVYSCLDNSCEGSRTARGRRWRRGREPNAPVGGREPNAPVGEADWHAILAQASQGET
jgi:hypothetical protein